MTNDNQYPVTLAMRFYAKVRDAIDVLLSMYKMMMITLIENANCHQQNKPDMIVD